MQKDISAYHWTGYEKLKNIRKARVLRPNSTLSQEFPLEVHDRLSKHPFFDRPITFAFIGEPIPASWRKQNDILRELFCHVSDEVLLTWELTEGDMAYVAEREFLKRGFHNPNYYHNPDELVKRAERYFESIVSLDNYDGRYKLPELIITTSIPWKNITATQVEIHPMTFRNRDILSMVDGLFKYYGMHTGRRVRLSEPRRNQYGTAYELGVDSEIVGKIFSSPHIVRVVLLDKQIKLEFDKGKNRRTDQHTEIPLF